MTSSPSSRRPRPERLLILALPALLAPALQAQTIDVGGQLTLAKPVMDMEGGDWFKGRMASGFGLRVPIFFDRVNALIPRADMINIPTGPVNIVEGDNSSRLYTEKAKVQILSIGMDYAYFFSGRPEEGFYAGCGLGVSQARFKDAQLMPGGDGGPLPAGTVWPVNQNKSSLQYALLTGLKFTENLGLEFRFTQSNYKGVGIPGTIVKSPMFALSFTVEF